MTMITTIKYMFRNSTVQNKAARGVYSELTEAPKRRPRVYKRHSRVNRTNRQRLDICPTKPLEPPKCARRRASPSFLGWPRWLRPLWSSSPESSGIQKQIQIQIQTQMQVQVQRRLADELSREDERTRGTDKMTRRDEQRGGRTVARVL